MKTLKHINLVLICLLAFAQISIAQDLDGETLFQQNCASCHQLNRKLVGPALAGVHERWDDQKALIGFIKNSQEVINGGNEYAQALYEEYNKVIMPPAPINEKEIVAVLDYIKTEGEAEVAQELENKAPPSDSKDNANQQLLVETSQQNTTMTVVVGIIIILLVLLGILIFTYSRLTGMINTQERERLVKAGAYKEKNSWWQLFRKDDNIKDAVLEGHEYDGIKEYDNNPPAWFNWLFYVTIFFAFVYMMYYHIFSIGDLPKEEYNKQIAIAEAKYGDVRAKMDYTAYEPNLSTDHLALGESIFVQNCANCHGNQGQGDVGPNLTDQYWIHGNEYEDILRVVYEGVQEKGMLAWKAVLNKDEIQAVSSYVESLRGTNPPNQKEPQGEKYTPES